MKLTIRWLLPMAAVRLLWGVTDADCSRTLEQALADKNPEVRKEAVVALSLIGPRSPGGMPVPERLAAMLEDKDVPVRLAAVSALAELRGKVALDALDRALDGPVPEVSFAAAKALWSLHDPAGERALQAVLGGESKTSSGYFTKEKRDALRMLHTPRTTFLFVVREGAGMAPIPGLGDGISSLQGLLTDAGVSGRAEAALLLAKDPNPATVAALKDALNDKDWSVRAAAIHALALRDDPAVKAELAPLLDDKKEAVRLRAAAGFLRLSGVEAERRKQRKRVAK